jgi:hypothetical protein
LAACGNDAECFWWSLLHAATGPSTLTNIHLKERVDLLIADEVDFKSYGTPYELAKSLSGNPAKRVFLIDGIETAVGGARLKPFVEALFRVLGTIQFEPELSSLAVRLFLRSDLAQSATQNVEQQTEGRSFELRWDRRAILNFAVARIASLAWFADNFSETCEGIEAKRDQISQGLLSEEDAEQFLLQVFPASLERNRLRAQTFFATYFSDAGGDDEKRASFYPRLFDAFLRLVAEEATKLAGTDKQEVIANSRLASRFIMDAYDRASGSFIREVQTELYTLLDLEQGDVGRLLDAFTGAKTPFVVEEMIGLLSERTDLEAKNIRESLLRMKALGMFEDRPGYAGQWRTGRVYKAGLKMKYVR